MHVYCHITLHSLGNPLTPLINCRPLNPQLPAWTGAYLFENRFLHFNCQQCGNFPSLPLGFFIFRLLIPLCHFFHSPTWNAIQWALSNCCCCCCCCYCYCSLLTNPHIFHKLGKVLAPMHTQHSYKWACRLYLFLVFAYPVGQWGVKGTWTSRGIWNRNKTYLDLASCQLW